MEDSLFHQNFCVTDTLLYRNCNRWDWSFISRVLSVGWPSYVGIQQLKIALIAPPFIAVPPADYGGTFSSRILRRVCSNSASKSSSTLIANRQSKRSAAGSMGIQIGPSRIPNMLLSRI